MIPDNERLALQNHIRRIEEYEQKQLAEKERLAAPFGERHAEILDRSHQAIGPADQQGVFTARGMTHEEVAEISKNHQHIENELNAYAIKHRPSLEPWDTPRAILETIEKKEFHWSSRLRELAESAGIAREETEWHQLNEKAAKDAYREIYKRLLAFVSLAPSIMDDMPEAHDPRIGIEQIRAWCLRAMQPLSTETRLHGEDPIALGLTERDELGRLFTRMIDAGISAAEREEAGRAYQTANSAWGRKWLQHSDARVALFFDLWQTRLVYSTVGALNRTNGTSKPSTEGTDKLIGYLHAAEGLRIRGIPMLPHRPLNEMELDAAYQQLRNAIRDNVAPAIARETRNGNLTATDVETVPREATAIAPTRIVNYGNFYHTTGSQNISTGNQSLVQGHHNSIREAAKTESEPNWFLKELGKKAVWVLAVTLVALIYWFLNKYGVNLKESP